MLQGICINSLFFLQVKEHRTLACPSWRSSFCIITWYPSVWQLLLRYSPMLEIEILPSGVLHSFDIYLWEFKCAPDWLFSFTHHLFTWQCMYMYIKTRKLMLITITSIWHKNMHRYSDLPLLSWFSVSLIIFIFSYGLATRLPIEILP